MKLLDIFGTKEQCLKGKIGDLETDNENKNNRAIYRHELTEVGLPTQN
jgi:hypothetical protein